MTCSSWAVSSPHLRCSLDLQRALHFVSPSSAHGPFPVRPLDHVSPRPQEPPLFLARGLCRPRAEPGVSPDAPSRQLGPLHPWGTSPEASRWLDFSLPHVPSWAPSRRTCTRNQCSAVALGRVARVTDLRSRRRRSRGGPGVTAVTVLRLRLSAGGRVSSADVRGLRPPAPRPRQPALLFPFTDGPGRRASIAQVFPEGAEPPPTRGGAARPRVPELSRLCK